MSFPGISSEPLAYLAWSADLKSPFEGVCIVITHQAHDYRLNFMSQRCCEIKHRYTFWVTRGFHASLFHKLEYSIGELFPID